MTTEDNTGYGEEAGQSRRVEAAQAGWVSLEDAASHPVTH